MLQTGTLFSSALLEHPAEGTDRAPEEDGAVSIVGAVDFGGETAVHGGSGDVVMTAPEVEAATAPTTTPGEAAAVPATGEVTVIPVADETALVPAAAAAPEAPAPPVKAPRHAPRGRRCQNPQKIQVVDVAVRLSVQLQVEERSCARPCGRRCPANQGGLSSRSRRRPIRQLAC